MLTEIPEVKYIHYMRSHNTTKDYVDRNTGGQVYSLHEVTQHNKGLC